MRTYILTVVMPANAGIQYAAASTDASGILDHPHMRG
jgi:hypothetical protein